MKSKVTNAMSNSQTLSQFQSVMQELDMFARKAGSKDRQKRKARSKATNAFTGGDTVKGKKAMRAPGIPNKLEATVGQKVKTRVSNAANKVSKSANKTATNAGNWLGNPVQKAKAGFQSNSISAAAGRSQNAAIKSTGSLGNTARKLGAAASNVAGTRAGKIGAGLIAGGALAGAAASLLRKKTAKKKK